VTHSRFSRVGLRVSKAVVQCLVEVVGIDPRLRIIGRFTHCESVKRRKSIRLWNKGRKEIVLRVVIPVDRRLRIVELQHGVGARVVPWP
jgi:hypothetical protein